MRSLDILEEAGVVLRNQGKGVFVSPEIQQNIHRRIAFCFPPEKFEPETVGAECWALASEFYRGLLAGAADEKAEVSFLQFPYECSETEKKQYLRQLSGFDVIIVEGVLILLNSSLKLKTVADHASLQNCAVSSENISESIKIKREFGFYLKANA